MRKDIGEIGNYYGGLSVLEKEAKFFWTIDDWDSHKGSNWEEIPESLYNELLKFEYQGVTKDET